MSSIEGIRQRLESLFAGVAEAIPTTGPLDRAAIPREVSRPRGWVWELDLEGKYTWCSPEIERILGYSRDEVQGKRFYSIGFDSQSAQTVQSQLEAGETIQQLILEAQHKDGRSFQILIRAMHRVDATGERLGYRGVTQLIDFETVPSERMAVQIPTPAEQIDATTPPSYVPSWGDLLGFEDTEGEIRPLEDTKDPRDLLSEEQQDHLVIPLQVQDEIIGVIELDSKQGGGSWDEDDRALANAIAHELAITLQDARSYQLTQQALEEMREADRLKSQFLANMSHELRTPLNSIIGFSRVILKGIDGPVTDTQEQDLNAIYNAGQHLLGLINNILDISKIEAGKMELAFTDVDLSEIIRGVMATAVGLVKDKPIELITDIPEQLPFVQADNIRIRQVLLNLVSNAAKFTEEGHIGVSARTIQRGTRNEVVIAVFDTGPGINQEDQERIFEPFSQVDASPTRKTGGTGLGLSISRHLVELHGGVIWVDSIPDEGSTFAFTLPFDPELQISRSSAPLILGVDHDPSSLLQYREVLENSGYRFHALTRPDQSTEVANTLQPKAILLDIADDPSTPWLILSSLVKDPSLRDLPILLSTLEERSEQGVLFPIVEWIAVPFSDEELCSWIEQLPRQQRGNPSILVIEQDPTWTKILTAVESHHCADLEHAASLAEIEDILRDRRPDAFLLNLALPDQLSLQALILLMKTYDMVELPILGMLPEQMTEDTLDALNTLFQSLDAKASTDRHTHLDRILSCLKEKVPVNA
jgi:PAS domain S-box-containing protein